MARTPSSRAARPGRRAKGFRKTRNGTYAPTSPERVQFELLTRRLLDLETCQRVWDGGHSIVAVMQAVRLSELPEWLADAVLLLHSATMPDRAPALGPMWKADVRKATDRIRADFYARSREGPKPQGTQDAAGASANAAATTAFPGLANVTPIAIRKAFERVAGNLHDPSAYYTAQGLDARLELARERVRARAAGARAAPTSADSELKAAAERLFAMVRAQHAREVDTG